MSFQRPLILTLIALAGLVGCAGVPPPKELVDARQAYARASDGPGHDLVPAELLTAQQALTRAEQAYLDAPDAARTRDLAYIAERRAQLADAQGLLASDARDKVRAQKELSEVQAANQSRMRSALSETRAELESQKQLLTAEQRARRHAERGERAALESLEKIAAVKEDARGVVITLNGSVLFATGQSVLLPIARERLAEVARALKDDPKGNIVVEGHTDSTGPTSMNEELSRRRAESVREFLIEQGIAADRLRAIGYGPHRPVADNKTPEGRANNRRVEIVIQPENAPPVCASPGDC